MNTLEQLINSQLVSKGIKESVKVKVDAWENEVSQVEVDIYTGKEEVFTYPRMRTVLIEAWNTWKYSERADGMFIREGMNLNGTGIPAEELASKVIVEMQERHEYLKAYHNAHDQADRENKVALQTTRGEFILVSPEVGCAFNPKEHYFKVKTEFSEYSWNTWDAKDAINNTLAHFPRAGKIVDVTLISHAEWETEYAAKQAAKGE